MELQIAASAPQVVPTPYAVPGGARPRQPRGRLRQAQGAAIETTTKDWTVEMRRVAEDRDTAAFAALFRHFAPRLKSYLIRSGARPGQAEEIMQEAMAALWNKAGQFDPSRASVATWLYTIARNRRVDVLRRNAARPEPEDLPWGPEAAPLQEDVVAFQQEAGRLARALRSLPEAQRAIIDAAFFGDLSHGEIARATGLPLGTIKSRIRLALDRLRHAMGKSE